MVKLFIFFVPGRVHKVVMSNFLVHFLTLLRVNHFLEFGRNAHPKFVRTDFCFRLNYAAGSNDGTFTNFNAVEKNGSHSDKCVVIDFCTVNCYVMTN